MCAESLRRKLSPVIAMFVALVCPQIVRASADDTAALQYQQAFYANAIATLERMKASNAENQKTAQMLTDCHMRVMSVYSPKLRETAYAVISNGGTYAQAKDAFNGAVATEAAAGGEREAAVRKMFEQAMKVGDECLKRLPRSDE